MWFARAILQQYLHNRSLSFQNVIGPCGFLTAAIAPAALAMLAVDAPRLVFAQQLGRRAPPRLILEVDIGERLPGRVADDEALGVLLDHPRRWEAARG